MRENRSLTFVVVEVIYRICSIGCRGYYLFHGHAVFVQLLFESDVYLLQPRRPLPRFNFCTGQARACAIDSILGAASSYSRAATISSSTAGSAGTI